MISDNFRQLPVSDEMTLYSPTNIAYDEWPAGSRSGRVISYYWHTDH